MGDAQGGEERVPAREPGGALGVEDEEGALLGRGGGGGGSDAAGLAVFDAAAAAVLGEPVEAAVLFVGVEGGGGALAQAGGDGEAAGAGADEEHVVDWGELVGGGHGWLAVLIRMHGTAAERALGRIMRPGCVVDIFRFMNIVIKLVLDLDGSYLGGQNRGPAKIVHPAQ